MQTLTSYKDIAPLPPTSHKLMVKCVFFFQIHWKPVGQNNIFLHLKCQVANDSSKCVFLSSWENIFTSFYQNWVLGATFYGLFVFFNNIPLDYYFLIKDRPL